ncbi:MAG: M14 family metallopeptidase [Pseudomonadota bacterium]
MRFQHPAALAAFFNVARRFRPAVRRTLCLTAAVLAAGLTASPAIAQISGAGTGLVSNLGEPLWPETRYNPQVPTFEKVLGYRAGERITSTAAARRYFEALAAARPKQLQFFSYGESWQGRPLYYLAIGSAENIQGLEQFEVDMQQLADPTTDSETAENLLSRLPASVWLAYSVHGNEISPTDAAMMTAYHLLAADEDPVVDQILAETIVWLTPVQNPDGRERFLFNFDQTLGLTPDADRQSAQHDQPWPGGRVNHYLFDLNRDWLALTQPETRGHVAALRRWLPLVFVDLHEMGPDATYYFAPEAVPYNPHLASDQRANLALFGRNNARWFDRFGIDYFTREIFDAFYPGYGASWPAYYGAVAMTYEQASVGGLAIRRRNGSTLTYGDSVRNHFVTSVSTAQATAIHREKLLRDFRAYQLSAVAEGERGVREYLISSAGDASAADKLAGVLTQQGVSVRRAIEPFSACGEEYPAGSYAVSLAQPAKRLIRTLLDPQVDMDAEFLEEQERRRSKDLGDQIYDVTSWSLPLMYNVTTRPCQRPAKGAFEPAGSEWVRPGSLENSGATVAYLAPWGTRAAARLLAAALRDGLRVRGSDQPFTQNGTRYPAGTLIMPVAGNPVDLGARLATMARRSGATVIGVSDSWVEEGPNFGSFNVTDLPAPRVALAWDNPTRIYSAGAARFVIERQFGYPVTPIRSDRLARADLSGYDVLILPETYSPYASALTASLDEWVREGGTVIALGNALDAVTQGKEPLLSLKREYDHRSPQPAGGNGDEENVRPVPGTMLTDLAQYEAAIVAPEQSPEYVPGVLLNADVESEHWLAAGVKPSLNVLLRGNRIYAPLRRDQGTTVARFGDPDSLLVSGYLWQENREQLAFKPFVVARRVGRGHVIGFTADPNVRGYLDGLNVLFMNAVLRSAGHSARLR